MHTAHTRVTAVYTRAVESLELNQHRGVILLHALERGHGHPLLMPALVILIDNHVLGAVLNDLNPVLHFYPALSLQHVGTLVGRYDLEAVTKL